MDNCVLSADSPEEYRKIMLEAVHIMDDNIMAKMNLRQWESNADDIHEILNTMVLGLKWNKETDELHCQIPKFQGDYTITKRGVLAIG